MDIMQNIDSLVKAVKLNALYVCSFLLIIAGLFICSAVVERFIRYKKGIVDKTSAARRAAFVGLLSAISAALMLIELPMPFAPFFTNLIFPNFP